MPQVVAEQWVPVPPATAFAVSQTTGEARLRWDPFVRWQRLVDADRPAKGVRTVTRARVGPRMVSEYVSYRPPTSVGMTMVRGPWFFASFGGGWRFVPDTRDLAGTEVEGTRAVWKYTYAVRPAWLRPVAEPIGQWLLGREIRARIRAFALACTDPVVLAAAADD
ncbi:SRPBCC family protein [Nocardioides sp. CPCC 205120]|uniref:SRPBCC family protein n=1 Tax=Nocardioides sp. CPCC 205120 TaxID=3406462 RepID=UPI003B50CA5D